MNRLAEIAKKKTRVVLGLMSGTSHDGIDAAIAKISGSGADSSVQLIHNNTYTYTERLRNKIEKSFDGTTPQICQLNFELGEAFADAALKCIKESGLEPKKIDIIASHGQTIYHIPPAEETKGSTLQIGEASVIAEKTGILTVSDFRTRDMAAGGNGAPLVPLADYILFSEKGKVKLVQNIGGIANVTVVKDKMEDVFAFDTGPGNSLIDESVMALTDGKMLYDKDGKMAVSGRVDEKLLKELMNHPYLSAEPPKATGKEVFGKEMSYLLTKLVTGEIGKRKNRKPEDLIATLTRFTSDSIFDAYQRFIFPKTKVHEVILSGGGSRNSVLVERLRELFEKMGKDRPKVSLIDQHGIPSSAKEALSFAILGNETIAGNPGNLQKATGARRPVVLGKINL